MSVINIIIKPDLPLLDEGILSVEVVHSNMPTEAFYVDVKDIGDMGFFLPKTTDEQAYKMLLSMKQVSVN